MKQAIDFQLTLQGDAAEMELYQIYIRSKGAPWFRRTFFHTPPTAQSLVVVVEVSLKDKTAQHILISGRHTAKISKEVETKQNQILPIEYFLLNNDDYPIEPSQDFPFTLIKSIEEVAEEKGICPLEGGENLSTLGLQ